MIRKVVVSFALAAIAALAGCTFSTQDKEQVKATVMRYNQLLAEGYRNLNMRALPEVAEDSQVSKVYFHMAALGEGRVRMVSQLKDIQFSDFSFANASTAQVKTREKWDFQHVNLDTQKVERNEKGFAYGVSYRLARHNGIWKVRVAETDMTSSGAPGKAGK